MNDNTPQEPMTLREWLAKLPPQAMELRVDAVTVLVGCIKPCGDHYHLENVRVISPCEAPGGEARTNYISNGASRKDIVVLMKELISRFEGMAEQKEGNA